MSRLPKGWRQDRAFFGREDGFLWYDLESHTRIGSGRGMVIRPPPAQSDIAIRLVKTWEAREIADLYRIGGWWKEEWDVAQLPNLMQGSYLFAVAVDRQSGQAVGMGRVISDGSSDAYIQDVFVDPAYRHRGIGCMLVAELVACCFSAGIRWIGCIAAPGTEKFYQELGFVRMKDYTPMLYGGGGGDVPI